MTGNFTQSSGATLVEQIGGTQAGQFGALAVTGTATLAGTLGVDLTGGFQPGQGASTSFLSAANVAGQFSSVVNVTAGQCLFLQRQLLVHDRERRGHAGSVRRPGGHPGCKGRANWWPACREP